MHLLSLLNFIVSTGLAFASFPRDCPNETGNLILFGVSPIQLNAHRFVTETRDTLRNYFCTSRLRDPPRLQDLSNPVRYPRFRVSASGVRQ